MLYVEQLEETIILSHTFLRSSFRLAISAVFSSFVMLVAFGDALGGGV